jgi:lysozyme
MIPIEYDPEVRNRIITHEDMIPYAYQDTRGWWTIACGKLVDKRKGAGLSQAAMHFILDESIQECLADLIKYDWYNNQDKVRQGVLIEMRFNLGMGGLLTFVQMIDAIKNKNYPLAVHQMLNSKWATQVGTERKDDLTHRLLFGLYK